MKDIKTIDQAIAIIRKEYLCVDRDCDIEKNCGKCDLMMPSKEPILEAYSMAIKALEQTRWIPVSERLPDDYGRYLISTEDGRVETINYGYTNDMPDEIAFYEWDDEEWQCWKPNVTAWMPRPKPYEPQERSDKE